MEVLGGLLFIEEAIVATAHIEEFYNRRVLCCAPGLSRRRLSPGYLFNQQHHGFSPNVRLNVASEHVGFVQERRACFVIGLVHCVGHWLRRMTRKMLRPLLTL